MVKVDNKKKFMKIFLSPVANLMVADSIMTLVSDHLTPHPLQTAQGLSKWHFLSVYFMSSFLFQIDQWVRFGKAQRCNKIDTQMGT